MPMFKKRSSKVSIKPSKSTLISIEDLENFLEKDKFNEYKTLRSWYEKLCVEAAKEAKECDKACLCGTILGNINKNRYKNLLPYDKYRVILGRTWEEFKEQQTVDPCYHSIVGNYINASYIGACNMNETGEVLNQESISNPKFIVTQDPLDSTIGDFWQMIYEQRSPMVINLSGATNESECRCYWPEEAGRKGYYQSSGGKMWVQLVHEAQKPVWVERNIKIWPDGHEHLCMFVRFMQYMGWVINYPPSTTNLLKFIDDVANPAVPIAAMAGPITVQCRGGIGRNGCFVTAWILKQNIELGMKGVDIFNMIKHLRRYRFGFVNSLEYFVELHRFALKIHKLIPQGGFKNVEYLKE